MTIAPLAAVAVMLATLAGGLFAAGAPLSDRSTDGTMNPHGDLIFRATATTVCTDCHGPVTRDGTRPVLDVEPVRRLVAKGKGNHGPGRFADCFRCHAGGRVGPDADR